MCIDLTSRKPYLAAVQRKLTALICATLVVYSIPFAKMSAAQDASAESHMETSVADLLEQLKSADAVQGKKIARDIKRKWAISGSASADFLLKRGRDALRAKKVDAAIEHLTALTDHAPDFAEGWHSRASAYYQKNLYGPAIEDLGRALTLNPSHFDAMQGLGAIFEQLGDPTRAYEVYEQVLAIHPHHADVLEAMERLEAKVKGPTL